MGWKTKVAVPSLAAIAYLVASFFTKIVPCQVYPNIPNPSPEWALCTLNPDKISFFGLQELYWGVTPQLSMAYLISLVTIFLCCFLLLVPFNRRGHFSKSKNKKETERRFETY